MHPDDITTLTGADLAEVVRALNTRSKAGNLRSLRIVKHKGQVQVKVNEGSWSVPIGRQGN